ncbi:MAG: radical SAM protein [Rhizobiales bacterium]|nr:radical SAM protein [Hyphomicrobiales bacterium]
MSSADNWTSCCCFYLGNRLNAFAPNGDLHTLGEIYKGAGLEALRGFQAGGTHVDGCGTCPYSIDARPHPQSYFDIVPTEATLSDRQLANLTLVRDDFQRGEVRPASKPLRAAFYFSWGCNLSCTFCYQVPWRDQWRTALPDDLFERCRDDFLSMLQVECIGGEPFAIPSALNFMRKFCADPELASVRLRITTNGTLLHKHMRWLKGKERVSYYVSLDSVGAGYEHLRVGAHWPQMHANLLALQEAIRTDRPEWRLLTYALLMKSGIPYLPEFARFHTENRISTMFDVLRLNRGNEEVVYHEDVVAFPALLDDIPGWRNYFNEALAIFEQAGCSSEAHSLAELLGKVDRARRQPWRNTRPFEGRPLATVEGAENMLRLIAAPLGKDEAAEIGVIDRLAGFKSADLEYGLAAKIVFTGGAPGGGTFGIRLVYPAQLAQESAYSHSILYEMQPFLLGSWREYTADDRRIVDMVVHSTAPACADTVLLLAFMNARPNIRNVLPVAFEIWVE